MSYLIAAGGTGQEIASAVVRLAYLTGVEPPDIVVIDSDVAPIQQGTQRTRHQALNQLHSWITNRRIHPREFLSTINPAQVSEPGEAPRAVRTVRDVFTTYGDLTPDDRTLLDLLLTPTQRQTAVNDGFHGHPAVGALVVAVASTRGDWKKLRDTIEEQAKAAAGVRVVVAGSVTGGVGTATLPTMIRQLAELRGRGQISLSGLFQLPWFTLDEVVGDDASHAPDVSDQMMDRNASCLVRGYLEQLIGAQMDDALLIGLPERVIRPSHGGSRQRETKHYVNVISGIQALSLLDPDEHRRLVDNQSGLFGMTLGEQPSTHYGGRPGGPAFKQFTVDRLCMVARTLVALSEALCFELQRLTPASTHQADVHRLLKGLNGQQRQAFQEAAEEFRLFHHEIWSWLKESLESRVGPNRADTIRAFEPDRRSAAREGWEKIRDSSTQRGLEHSGVPASFLSLGRRLIGRLGPYELDRDRLGDRTAWGLFNAARRQIHQTISGQ